MNPTEFRKTFPTDQTLFLIDISSFIFRAFYAIRSLSNRKGEPTNAVFGVASMLKRLIDEAGPEHLAAVFDSKEPSVRKLAYDAYKANRSAPPEELVPQFDRIEALVEAMGIQKVRKSTIEADDLIATLARRWLEADTKHRVVIVTGDKDLMQLVSPRLVLWDTMKEKIIGAAEVEEKLGVRPDQVCDYLALVGDSSDNIPGVVSFGPKGAADTLREHGTLARALEAARSGQWTGKKAAALLEHEADAHLSRKLVELDANVPDVLQMSIAQDVAIGFRFHFSVSDRLMALLHELDFQTLAQKWQQSAAASDNAPATNAPMGLPSASVGVEWITVDTRAKLEALVRELKKAPEFGFDTETTSLNPREARLVGLSFCCGDNEAHYVPVGHVDADGHLLATQCSLEDVEALVRPLIEDPRHKKIGQNLKFDWSILTAQGWSPQGIGADTMVAGYVLDPSGRHNLDVLSKKYLDYSPIPYEAICGKGKSAITFDRVSVAEATRYSAEDAWCAWRLWRVMQPELNRLQLTHVFAQVDLPLVPVLSRMEMAGVCIDVEWLNKLSQQFALELAAIESKIAAFTPKPINLNSPKQLAELLFEDLKLPPQGKTKTGYSTDATVLEALAPLHEVPGLLLEYREISKLKGTYVDPLPAAVDAKTGRLHASFHQTVAATGRLSSSDPNLQNIPIRTSRGQLIRKAFVATAGSTLLSADYSQIELRILAHMSGDEDLIRSFKNHEDIHRRTASEIYGVAPDSVTEPQRALAKAINFGLMYGKTAFGLAQELSISRAEAKAMIDRYFQRYAAVKRFLDSLIGTAKEKGYTETLLGRKRLLPDLHSKNPMVRANAERMAMNTPIQGTAADLIKLAMIALDDALRERRLKSRLTIQVHDELVVEAVNSELAVVEPLVRSTMESAMKLNVPLVANVATGQNWMDL